MTPLMYAVKENKLSVIDRIIDLGCDVAARNLVSRYKRPQFFRERLVFLV